MMQKVTITDVARESGYGVGTVSRVISGDKSVKDSTRDKINKVIADLHYVPNVNGARLRKKHSGVIAVMVPVINHPFFAEFVERVEEIADKNGCSLLLVTSQMNKEKEAEILKKIRQREIDGAIFVTHYQHDQKELEGCSLVSIDRHLSDEIPLVSSDNYQATRKALETLYAHGARRIGFLGTEPSVESEVSLRKQAYDDFVKEKGLPSLAKWEIVDHGKEEELVLAFLKEYGQCDAVFASNAIVANGFRKAAIAQGIRFPEDCELICYDGVSPVWGDGSISCLRQDIQAMAETSFLLLQDLIEGKEVKARNIIPTQTILGQTTR